MDSASFIKALDLESDDRLHAMTDAFNRLHDLPHSFTALNWHSSHEYMYISRHVAAMTGYPYENFEKYGIMFLISVTPPEMIDHISSTLYHQLTELENDPRLITRPVTISVEGCILHKDGTPMPFLCPSTILDFIPGQRKAYLILSSYIHMEEAGRNVDELHQKAFVLQKKIHSLYMQMNPSRFRAFRSYKLLTPRELEIAELIRSGYNSRTIADKLSIALHTVTSHRKSLLKKMNAGNTAEMVHILNQVS